MYRVTRPYFDGQVGPVVFRDGVGVTDDPDMLAHFTERPDVYAVETCDGSGHDFPHEPAPFGPQPNPEV